MPPNPNTSVIAPHMQAYVGTIFANQFYKSEQFRLDSYRGFPVTFLDVGKLATAGFYYTRKEDVVCCAFCGLQIGSWEQQDDPLSEHKKWRANCPFLNGQEVGNIPITPSNRSTPSEVRSEDECGIYNMESRNVDECGLYNITPVGPNVGSLERLGITRTVQTHHPAFVNLHDRLKSFDTWPMALQPRPEALATAGFFYTGQGDRCVCFQCGGGLKDWSDTDDPWVEHAKFFPLCTHVINNKGQDFINSCRIAPPPNPISEPSTHIATSQDTSIAPSVETTAIESPSETTSSSSEASCSRTEATTEVSRPSEESEEEGKPLGTETCTKGDTKEERSEALMCKICYQKEMAVAFLPCGHVVACAKCAPSLQHCAVCRKRVTATVRVYLA